MIGWPAITVADFMTPQQRKGAMTARQDHDARAALPRAAGIAAVTCGACGAVRQDVNDQAPAIGVVVGRRRHGRRHHFAAQGDDDRKRDQTGNCIFSTSVAVQKSAPLFRLGSWCQLRNQWRAAHGVHYDNACRADSAAVGSEQPAHLQLRPRTRMRDTLLTALTAAALLSATAPATDTRAEMLVNRAAAPLQAQTVVSVCGTNGCVKVQTHKIVRQKPGSVASKHI
jgi:hypothetical protein